MKGGYIKTKIFVAKNCFFSMGLCFKRYKTRDKKNIFVAMYS